MSRTRVYTQKPSLPHHCNSPPFPDDSPPIPEHTSVRYWDWSYMRNIETTVPVTPPAVQVSGKRGWCHIPCTDQDRHCHNIMSRFLLPSFPQHCNVGHLQTSTCTQRTPPLLYAKYHIRHLYIHTQFCIGLGPWLDGLVERKFLLETTLFKKEFKTRLTSLIVITSNTLSPHHSRPTITAAPGRGYSEKPCPGEDIVC